MDMLDMDLAECCFSSTFPFSKMQPYGYSKSMFVSRKYSIPSLLSDFADLELELDLLDAAASFDFAWSKGQQYTQRRILVESTPFCRCSKVEAVSASAGGFSRTRTQTQFLPKVSASRFDRLQDLAWPLPLPLPLPEDVKKVSVKKEWEAQDGSKAEFCFKYEPAKSSFGSSNSYSYGNNATVQRLGLGQTRMKHEWKAKTVDGSKAELSFKWEPKEKKEKEAAAAAEKCEKLKLKAKAGTFTKASSVPARVIPIEDGKQYDPTVSYAASKLQLAFNRSRAIAAAKGKKSDLSPQEAALIIQAKFKEYMFYRSQNLRALKELAVAKERLKELRSLFSSYGYRRHLCRDEEEKQRFSEKVIVLLLTVESIEGSNYLVRESRRSMVQELEAMLDTLDPHSASFRKRKFDLPDSSAANRQMEMEVQQVVEMVEAENGPSAS